MTLRLYDEKKDKKAVHRIWQEVGWIGSDKKENKAMDIFLSTSTPWVAELNGEAECLVITTPGTIRHNQDDLSLCAVTGVTTSRVSRKQGFAGRLTARALAEAVSNGALVAGLGIFDQGFYNLLGFGNGTYENWISFDPASLHIDKKPRIPQRLSADDWKIMHQCRLDRLRTHGNCSLLPPEITKSETLLTQGGFGLGYYDGPDGTLSHYLWCKAREEHGPYTVLWNAYQMYDQLMELLALIKQWGDQVHLVTM
ncbi:MAG: GNAT family N-acetyltransferase, partial [Anaerolineae bacterium]|nr:GNAT family N-acetyltransferase [Anaerolineae bacterium]